MAEKLRRALPALVGLIVFAVALVVLRKELHTVTWNPGKRYASPFPGGDSHVPQGLKYQQDAIEWLRGGFIDAIMPMEYTMDDRRWQENAKSWLSFRYGDPCGVYLGLGWLTEKGKPDWGYDASGIVRKIKYGRTLGLRGLVIFELSAFHHIDHVLVDALSVDSVTNDFSAPFKAAVESCLTDKGSRCQETTRSNGVSQEGGKTMAFLPDDLYFIRGR